MRRLRLRRSCIYLVGVGALLLLALNMHFRDQWTTTLIPNGLESLPLRFAAPPPTHNDAPPSPPVTATAFTDAELFGPGRPWFMSDGWLRPGDDDLASPDPDGHIRTPRSRRTFKTPVWPHQDDGDRIVNQLMFIPRGYEKVDPSVDGGGKADPRLKRILLHNGLESWQIRPGRSVFLKSKCPVDTCSLTTRHEDAENVDAVLFRNHFSQLDHRRPANQVWILYLLECPMHTQTFHYRRVFNWTATYRHDSDIVTPYEKFVLYDPHIKQKPKLERNFAFNKTKKVAWFVSNCGARNNRLQYARELRKYIDVDIFGACGTRSCPRTQHDKCSNMLNRDYKFYLSFENSNCKDYITEKFFVNGLMHDIVPIVMGARKEDYVRVAPYNSFISVEDFDSPKELADYLHILDKNDTLYNEYFRWKGTGEFINTYFWCRLCALLHDERTPKVYNNLDAWWRGPGTCVSGSWKKHDQWKQNKII